MADRVERIAAPKLLCVPEKVHTLEEMFGMLKQLDGMQNVVLVIEDAESVWTMTLDGTTAERMNWMLDRAKVILHKTYSGESF